MGNSTDYRGNGQMLISSGGNAEVAHVPPVVERACAKPWKFHLTDTATVTEPIPNQAHRYH